MDTVGFLVASRRDARAWLFSRNPLELPMCSQETPAEKNEGPAPVRQKTFTSSSDSARAMAVDSWSTTSGVSRLESPLSIATIPRPPSRHSCTLLRALSFAATHPLEYDT